MKTQLIVNIGYASAVPVNSLAKSMPIANGEKVVAHAVPINGIANSVP